MVPVGANRWRASVLLRSREPALRTLRSVGGLPAGRWIGSAVVGGLSYATASVGAAAPYARNPKARVGRPWPPVALTLKPQHHAGEVYPYPMGSERRGR